MKNIVGVTSTQVKEEDMGAIMYATSESTAEEYGGTFATKATEVEPVSVLSIPANTYSTYALALAALETAFDALSADDKKKTKIVEGDDTIHSIQSTGYKLFARSYVYNGSVYYTTYNLASHKLEGAIISNTYAYSEQSLVAQSRKLELIIC